MTIALCLHAEVWEGEQDAIEVSQLPQEAGGNIHRTQWRGKGLNLVKRCWGGGAPRGLV